MRVDAGDHVRRARPDAELQLERRVGAGALGVDACPMEGFDPWRAKRVLKLPRGAEVCMFLAVGKRAPEGATWWERILVPKDWVVSER